MSLFLDTFFPSVVKNIKTDERILYLTFDDGPVPDITDAVLETLKKYNAIATFFCLGKNVDKHGDIFEKISVDGHSIGNHSYNHPNGWKTKTKVYVDNVNKGQTVINERNKIDLKNNKPNIQSTINKPLFRPPYGKLTPRQYYIFKSQYKIILWDVPGNDWIENISADKRIEIVKEKTKNGSIIVLHDNADFIHRMLPTLKFTLDYFTEKGYRFEGLNMIDG